MSNEYKVVFHEKPAQDQSQANGRDAQHPSMQAWMKVGLICSGQDKNKVNLLLNETIGEPPMEKGKLADELVAAPIPKSHLSFPVAASKTPPLLSSI
ncbi:hypothetical protein LXL04_012314 [Taraxacum kok-saghyz]